MKRVYLFILFLVVNFGGLALGNWFMGEGASSTWYTNLNKAPWTPAGWVFGLSWSLIMICFSIYLSYLFSIRYSVVVTAVFVLAFLLNVSWNYFFFDQHFVTIALVIITLLTLTIFYLYITFQDDKLNKMKYLLLPYLVWLSIATSLNAYVVINN